MLNCLMFGIKWKLWGKSWPVESRTCNRKVLSSSLGLGEIVGGGSECTALAPPSVP